MLDLAIVITFELIQKNIPCNTMSEEANIPSQKPGDIIQNSELNKKPEPQPQVQTNDMETHAQHLHNVPGQGWKHYFFEFFMLFLAVTLGFFVENLRENIIETH